jgi:hypothetical protein
MGMPNENGEVQHEQHMHNVHVEGKNGTVTTSSVIAELKKNAASVARLEEYVKYEQQITDFAMAVHLKQCESLKKAFSCRNPNLRRCFSFRLAWRTIPQSCIFLHLSFLYIILILRFSSQAE